MSIEADKQHAREFIETCTADELTKLATFAITHFPCAEKLIRKVLIVMVAMTKAGN
jgi:hypothetical protein